MVSIPLSFYIKKRPKPELGFFRFRDFTFATKSGKFEQDRAWKERFHQNMFDAVALGVMAQSRNKSRPI
jgi:hypothetical protein